jgi:hypothetical protein
VREGLEKLITIFGTSHRVQGALKATHLKHITDPDYTRYLEDQLRANHFDFVFEEATECGPTIAEDLATKFLGKGHYLDVDPHPSSRSRFGIPPLRDERTQLEDGCVFHEDLDGQALREKLWVKRCTNQAFTCALFICGHLHTLSLSFRLQAAGFAVIQASVYVRTISSAAPKTRWLVIQQVGNHPGENRNHERHNYALHVL